MIHYICRRCGTEVISDNVSPNMEWTDGHKCQFVKFEDFERKIRLWIFRAVEEYGEKEVHDQIKLGQSGNQLLRVEWNLLEDATRDATQNVWDKYFAVPGRN